jgi:hypothetical protein
MTSISGRRFLGRKVRNWSEVRICSRFRINVELGVYAQVIAEANDGLHFGNNDTYVNAQADFLWTPIRKEIIRCATAPSGPGPSRHVGVTITLRPTTLGRSPLDE